MGGGVAEVCGVQEGAKGFALGDRVGLVDAGEDERNGRKGVAGSAGSVVEAVKKDDKELAKEAGSRAEDGTSRVEEVAETGPHHEAAAIGFPGPGAEGREGRRAPGGFCKVHSQFAGEIGWDWGSAAERRRGNREPRSASTLSSVLM
jgi:hypothetical protein